MTSSSRLGLVRRAPGFGLLFLATAGSAFGTYLAAIALVVHVKVETGSGLWVAALLIAEFAPIVVIGLLFGPLVDRLSRRRLMVVSDLVRGVLFLALMLVDDPAVVVAVAGLVGVATGFFRPAAYAGLPNLVPDEELTNANSLLQTVETLAWMIGPVLAGLMLTVWSPSVPYAVNAVTFLVSAALIARIPESKLRSEEPLTAGHWRDVADGLRLVVTTPPLRTVLVVWSAVVVGNAAVNVAEVFFAQDVLQAGNVGFGVIVGASGVGLAIGSYLAAPAIGRVGLRRHYVAAIALMGFGWGAAALSSSIWVAVPFVVAATIGNGAAIVANQLFVQRGATDRYRGRALATIMSVNYAALGIAMAIAGVATDAFGARAVWLAAAAIFVLSALATVALTRWLKGAREERLLEAHAEAAARSLAGAPCDARPRSQPVPEDGRASGLERIAALLEEIERRRELEAGRRAKRSASQPLRSLDPTGGTEPSLER
ncbi:MAG: MFS transporter [Thermoleophilia bacterium]|nr:MFS transporter [Gaiellaceae bacterium]MDW8339031.1 MFS transporter [Thermoleophilia bacterium]